MSSSDDSKFAQQAGQYAFPYHYVPHFVGGVPRIRRHMGWGLEYLCYQEHLAHRALALAPASALDVGCGDGYFIGRLGAAVSRRVGVDLAEPALRFARAFHPDVTFLHASAESLNEQFALVTAIEVLEHVPDDRVSAFLRALAARLAPGGTLLLSVPTTNVPLHPKHHRHYDESLLREQLASSGAALRIDSIEYVYRRNTTSSLLRRVISNRFISIDHDAFLRAAWWLTQRYLKQATASDGSHLIATIHRA